MTEETAGTRTLLGDQRKGVIALAIPIGVALFFQQLNNIVDSLWVAGLGGSAMSALGIVYPIYTILIGIGNGLGIGVGAAIARNIGQRNHADANKSAAQGVFITAVVSIILTPILLLTAEYTMVLMGAGDTVGDCLDYAYPIYLSSFFVILSGAKMLKDTASPLIGNPMKKEVVDEILQEAKKDPRILGVHDLLLHDYGPTKRFVSFHAEVDSRMNFMEAHEMIDDLEESLRNKYGLNVSIHMDPILVGDEETERTKDEVLACLKELDPALKIHDFRLVDGKGHANVLFDIVLPFDEKLSEQEITAALNEHFANRKKTYNIKVTFDRPFTE